MPVIPIDLDIDTFQSGEKSIIDEILEVIKNEPAAVAFLLLFCVGAPLIGYALMKG